MRQLALVLLAAAIGTACDIGVPGNGRIESESRPIGAFTELNVMGGFVVTVIVGQSPSLTVTTDQNLLANVKSEVSDGRLRVYTDERVRPTHDVKVVITTPSLSNVSLTGAVKFTSDHLASDRLELHSTGASTMQIRGRADDLKVDLTGASTLQAEQLVARRASVSLIGASSADMNVSDELKASITGAGSLTYSGSPSVTKSILGAGSIRQR
jgi:hypothetical protein